MSFRTPFRPAFGSTKSVSVTSTSSSITINKNDKSVRLINNGANIVYVRVGEGAQTATVADLPILPAQTLIIEKSVDSVTLAAYSPVTSTLLVTTGEGGI